MQIALHIGAHGTDNDRLIQSLHANAPQLSTSGVLVPTPHDYRKPMHDMLMDMIKGGPIDQSARGAMLRAMGLASKAERTILSNENVLGRPHRIFEKGKLYPIAPRRLSDLMGLLPVTELKVYMAIRNPVTFVPATFAKVDGASLDEFMDGVALRDVRWSEMLERMVTAVPNADFTVWCNEDTPLLWGDLMREMAGVASETELAGDFAVLKEIMTTEGLRRLETYLAGHPPQSSQQRQRILAAFLDKFARPDTLEQEVDLPGMTPTLVQQITAAYEADLERVASLPGVRLLMP